MFVGLMVDGERINVLEYNVRFGDPECEPLMMRFEGDLAETLLASAEGRLNSVNVRLSPRAAAAVVLASGGYPGEYRKGVPISGLERIDGAEPSDAKVRWALQKTRVKVFHAGTATHEGRLVTDGGRVLVVTAMAADLRRAVAAAYEAAAMIEFEGKQMRRDIARRALDRASSMSGIERCPVVAENFGASSRWLRTDRTGYRRRAGGAGGRRGDRLSDGDVLRARRGRALAEGAGATIRDQRTRARKAGRADRRRHSDGLRGRPRGTGPGARSRRGVLARTAYAGAARARRNFCRAHRRRRRSRRARFVASASPARSPPGLRRPLTATSANLAGEPPAVEPERGASRARR